MTAFCTWKFSNCQCKRTFTVAICHGECTLIYIGKRGIEVFACGRKCFCSCSEHWPTESWRFEGDFCTLLTKELFVCEISMWLQKFLPRNIVRLVVEDFPCQYPVCMTATASVAIAFEFHCQFHRRQLFKE